jgi:hypothetical protein
MLQVLEPLIHDEYTNGPQTWTYHWSLPKDDTTIKGLEMYRLS